MTRIKWLGLLAGAGSMFLTGRALATGGVMVVTANRTLTETHYGTIRIAADNVTLDCNNHQVRYRPSGPAFNCALNTKQCGIAVEGFDNVKIKNCGVVGGTSFDIGMYFTDAQQASVSNSYINGAKLTGLYADFGTIFLDVVSAGAVQSAAPGIDYNAGYHFFAMSSVVANVIYYTNPSQSRYGLSIVLSHNVDITDPVLASTNPGTGVRIADSSYVTIRGVEPGAPFGVAGFQTGGILLERSNHVTLDGPMVYSVGGTGLTVKDTDNSVIKNGSFSSSGACDATQDNLSTHNQWLNNTIPRKCGSLVFL